MIRPLIIAGALAIAACGVSFSGGESTEAAASSNATSASTASAGGADSSAGGMMASTGPGSSTGGSAGGQYTGGDPSGGGSMGSGGSAASGGNPPSPSVYCQGTLCAAGDVCCWDREDNEALACSAVGCEQGHIPISCDGADDCPGEICCGHLTPPMGETGWLLNWLRCEPICAGVNESWYCDSQNDCPQGMVCVPSPIGAEYNYCV